MAFSPDQIETAKKVDLVDYLDDDGALTNQTVCLTDGDTSSDCEELNGEAEGHRIEVNVPPGAWTSFNLRVHCSNIMSAGNVALLAYTDDNSVTATEKIVVAAATSYFDFAAGVNFMAQLGSVGAGFVVRVVADDGQSTKFKVCEYEFEPTWNTTEVSGVTRDNDGVILGSMVVQAFRVVSTGPLVTQALPFDSDTSNAVTGVYALNLYTADWVLRGFDAGSPDKMDITERITVSV